MELLDHWLFVIEVIAGWELGRWIVRSIRRSLHSYYDYRWTCPDCRFEATSNKAEVIVAIEREHVCLAKIKEN